MEEVNEKHLSPACAKMFIDEAVIEGITEVFAEIHVDDICVKFGYRHKGLGARLLQEVEDRFISKGYNNINLVTSEFQATEFYKKCGFEVEVIRKNKQNPKLTKTFFIKYIDDIKSKNN